MKAQTLITPLALQELLMSGEPVVIMDTRSPEAYAKSHIPGAVNVPEIFTYLATSDPTGVWAMESKFVEEFGKAGLSGRETAVIYEEAMNTGYGQSCRGYYLLQLLGYPKASILHGGLHAWAFAGLPIAAGTVTPHSARFPVNLPPFEEVVTKEEMLAALDDPAIVKLDVRDYEEWVGHRSSPDSEDLCPRAGRLPGAVWMEWGLLMDPDADPPVFRSKGQINATLRRVGITPESTVYVYCFHGARASNTFVALKEAGVKNVKVYFGSWNEWSQDFSLPIEEGAPQQEKLAAMA